MKTDAIRLDILKIIFTKESCGYEIHRRLLEAGKEVDIGRLYKILIEMLTEGQLGCRWETSEKGPKKRIYRLAAQGIRKLDEELFGAIETIHVRYEQYLLGLPTKTSIFQGFARMANPEEKNLSEIALLAAHPNPMHEPILSAFQNKHNDLEVLLILPRKIDLGVGVKNFTSMKGEYDSIPLRERFLDLLVIEGLPEAKTARKAIEEWCRVLKNDGTLVVISPRAIFSTLKDPLTLGDFVEKMEHQNLMEKELVNGETLQNLLADCFLKVQRKEVLQMTILVCHEFGKPPLPLTKSISEIDEDVKKDFS